MNRPAWEPLDWYDAPLYYDIVFDADTEQEADFLEAVWREHGEGPGRRVLEPACGSGRLVRALARRGWQAAGFDRSRPMLGYARRRLRRLGLRARLVEGGLADFDLGDGFDLAHCLVSTFKYLLTEGDARDHLRSVAAALRPGGVYVLGLHLLDRHKSRPDHETWTERRGGVRVTSTVTTWPADPATRLERVRSRLRVERGGQIRRYQSEWQFRSYDVGQLRRLLRKVPALEHVATYDFDYDLSRAQTLGHERIDQILVLRRR